MKSTLCLKELVHQSLKLCRIIELKLPDSWLKCTCPPFPRLTFDPFTSCRFVPFFSCRVVPFLWCRVGNFIWEWVWETCWCLECGILWWGCLGSKGLEFWICGCFECGNRKCGRLRGRWPHTPENRKIIRTATAGFIPPARRTEEWYQSEGIWMSIIQVQ